MRIFPLIAGMALFVSSAQADSIRDTLRKVSKCSDIAAAAERLQCYDGAAMDAKSVLAALPSTAPKSPEQQREEFGIPKPTIYTSVDEFGKPPTPKPDEPAEIEEISANVLELGMSANGKAIFVLSNGQVWRQIDGDTNDIGYVPEGEQMKVIIEKAVFGSFSLSIDGRRGIIKVRRLK